MSVTVVGIGADGWEGLPDASRRVLESAEVVLGSERQLALLPFAGGIAWPKPMLPELQKIMQVYGRKRVAIVASGDPMLFGIGGTLVRLLGPGEVRILPHPSSVSLACARLGWPVEETDVVSAVGRPLALLNAVLQPRRRVLVLGADPAAVAAFLVERGFGASRMWALSMLGGPEEHRSSGTAEAWSSGGSSLTVVALEPEGGPALSTVPGLPDEAYQHDGQLTKREIRAISLARLAPSPGMLLWDVGAGAGSIGIEWMRAHRTCSAIAIESHPERVARIAGNAAALGVPGLAVVHGSFLDVVATLEPPDAIFVGGGATVSGLIDACWAALRPGGRLVVNAVTVESEAVVAGWHARLGGELVRIAIQRAAPVGTFTGWRPAMPVTQWAVGR